MKGEIISLKTAEAIMKLQEENKKLKQWDINKDTRNSRQRVEIKRLLRQNKELEEKNEYFNKINMELSTLNTSLRSDRDNYQYRIDKLKDYINARIQVLTVSVDNKSKDQYFNNKCIGGVQELKNVKSLLEGKDE